MAAPEYDFFATGPRPTPPAAPDRFGTPAAPQAPVQSHYAPAPAAAQAPAVNQFGLPVDAAVPTGPLAAPGYGAVPVHNSIAAGYDDAPSVWDPAAALAAGRAHSRAVQVVADERPGAVLAAGIIAIVLGVIGTLAGAFILFGYLGAKGQIEEALAAGGQEVEGMEGLASAFLTAILVAGLVVTAISVLYIVLGAMTARGRRWAGWTIVVLSALSLLGSLRQVLDGSSSGATVSYGIGSWIAIGTTVVLLLLLTLGEGGRWLRRS